MYKYGLSIGCIFFPALFSSSDQRRQYWKNNTLWNPEGLEIGLENKLLWLMYVVVVLERDKLFNTLLDNNWGATTNLIGCLWLIPIKLKLKRREVVVFMGTFSFITGALVILQLDPVRKRGRHWSTPLAMQLYVPCLEPLCSSHWFGKLVTLYMNRVVIIWSLLSGTNSVFILVESNRAKATDIGSINSGTEYNVWYDPICSHHPDS